ncbi:MAG: DUF99 family protein [Nitrososphaerales archaeon]|nr:DUF99 family protein [Nitrososphaerales archaeon]
MNKKGIRALGIAESFRKGKADRSILSGVVMRSDLIIDGFVFGSATLGGDDATDQIIKMFERLRRNDINLIMLGGAIISLYNIIDIDRLYQYTNTPIICLTFEESKGLEPHIKHHFPQGWEKKLEAYKKLGERVPLRLKTGHTVYVRTSGITIDDAEIILNRFTLQGSIPEPIKVARILARSRLDEES